jgi:starch phosphorylase
MREYVEKRYLPAASAFRRWSADGARLAPELRSWADALERHLSEVRFGDLDVSRKRAGWCFAAQVYLGAVPADVVRVELYADPADGQEPVRQALDRAEAVPGTANAYVYRGTVSASSRPWCSR